jgi:5-methylcytosine-specific restriction endonuclease McrA
LTAAAKKSLSWELTGAEFVDLLCQNCHYCGAAPAMDEISQGLRFTHNGIDRKDNGQGYTKENCVTACWNCNRAKGTLSYEEFLSWLRQVALFRK